MRHKDAHGHWMPDAPAKGVRHDSRWKGYTTRMDDGLERPRAVPQPATKVA